MVLRHSDWNGLVYFNLFRLPISHFMYERILTFQEQ